MFKVYVEQTVEIRCRVKSRIESKRIFAYITSAL
jgi:hypothetical protein